MSIKDLIPITKRSKEEAKAISKKGGINSGKAKQRKKFEREERKRVQMIMQSLLSLPLREGRKKPLPDDIGAQIRAAGSLEELTGSPKEHTWGNISIRLAFALILIKKGLEGDTKSIDLILRIIGENTTPKGNALALPVIISREGKKK